MFQLAALEKRIASLETTLGKDLKILVSRDIYIYIHLIKIITSHLPGY